MSVSSLCEICTTGEVEYTCRRCGKLVCDKHYDEETGWCTECVADSAGSEDIPDSDDMPDGVDTYEF